MLGLSLNTKQVYVSHRFDPFRNKQSGPDWNCERWRGTPHFSNLRHYRSLTIKLFDVIQKTLFRGGCYHSAEMELVYTTALADWACFYFFEFHFKLIIEYQRVFSCKNVSELDMKSIICKFNSECATHITSIVL